MAGHKHLLHSVHHLLIGITLVLKGLTKLAHHPIIGSAILLFGIIILVYFFYLVWKKYPKENLHLTIHVFEALACLFTGYILFREGAIYLPYVFLLAAIGFLISIYISWYRKKNLPGVDREL